MQPAQHINALLAIDAILSQPLFAFALLPVPQTMMTGIMMVVIIMMAMVVIIMMVMVVIPRTVVMMVLMVVIASFRRGTMRMIVWMLIIMGMGLALISEMEETHMIYQVAECSIVDVTSPFILPLIVVEELVLISSAA